MKTPRVYVDTSVIGGCFDARFAEESQALIQAAREGKIVLLVSDLLTREMSRAPEPVQGLIPGLPSGALEMVEGTDESERLRDAYLKAGVVGPAHAADAHHIALATVARADLVVSWNFRHIVHWEKIRLFNAVNLREGYPAVDIRSPKEVI